MLHQIFGLGAKILLKPDVKARHLESSFLEAHTAPVVDGREGRKAVEIVLAIYRSAQTGRTVELT